MNSHFKLALLAALLAGAAPIIGEDTNVCNLTSQDGLNSCRKAAQGDYWNVVGMCANISDSPSRQACIQKAKSDTSPP
jgi:hypothetical protein